MAKPKQSKYARARVRSRVRRPKHGASRAWLFATVAITVALVVLVVVSYEENHAEAGGAPQISDHWHSYLGVNLCGTWAPAVPAFENRDGTDTSGGVRAGIHSHGDYLIHEHPFASDETGKQATLGLYLSYAQTRVTATSIDVWPHWVPDASYSNGDTCPGSDKPGTLYWKVGRHNEAWPQAARSGNPADYHMENGDIIAIYFVPEGSKLEQPPGSDEALAQITDLAPGETSGLESTTTTPPASTPADTATSTAPGGTSPSSTP